MSEARAFGRDDTIAELLDAVADRGTALIGPPGAGLSTVARAVASALDGSGCNVRLIRLPDHRFDAGTMLDSDVLIVDDAHRATPSQLLALRDRAVLRPTLVGTRTGAAPDALRWLWRSGALAHVTLPRLSGEAIGEIVEARAGGSVHRATLDGIVYRSAGRPGFAVDEIDSLVTDGRLTTRSGMLHGRLTGHVGTHLIERAADVLADLPAPVAEMVETLAVAGRLLAAAMAELRIDVPELERRMLVIQVDTERGALVQLDPPGLAAAIRAGLTPTRAIALADQLRSSSTVTLAPDDRARIQVIAGERVELADLAAATRTALNEDRRIEAISLARQAADRGPEGVAVEAELLAELGARAEASERYASLMADRAAPAHLRAIAAMEHSLILMWDLAQPDDAVAIATGLAGAAVGTPFQSAAEVHLASLTMYAGRPADAAHIIASVEPGSLDEAVRPGYTTVASIAGALVDPATADPTAACAAIEAPLSGSFERGVLVAAAELALELAGRYAEAGDVVARERAIRDVETTPASMAWLALAEARCELAIGRHRPSLRAALESAAMFDDIHHPSGLRWAIGSSMLAAAMSGDTAATRRAVEAFEVLESGVPFLDADLLRARAWAAFALGNSASAGVLLDEASELAAAQRAVSLEAVALHDSFRLVHAPVRARLAALARRAPAPAIVLRARHVELVAAGDPHLLLELAGDFERVGALLLAAEVAADAARMAASLGLRTTARTAVGQRVRLAAMCGDPVTPSLADHAPIRLTTRERDVVTLAVAGRSSREIARELTVSVRTVDNLLQRSYVKLGVHGRAELAERMTGG